MYAMSEDQAISEAMVEIPKSFTKVQITAVHKLEPFRDRINQWYTNPGTYIAKAKERARLALTDPSIKLTTLERIFYSVFQVRQQDLSMTNSSSQTLEGATPDQAM